MAKAKRSGNWWQPPRGAEKWIQAVLEYAIDHEAAVRESQRQRLSAEEAAWFETTFGRTDRERYLMNTLTGVAFESSYQAARLRLWLDEGWVPPEAPPEKK